MSNDEGILIVAGLVAVGAYLLWKKKDREPFSKSELAFGITKNGVNQAMPTNSSPTVNVNSSNTLTIFKEKGVGAVPYQKSSKLGWQGAN